MMQTEFSVHSHIAREQQLLEEYRAIWLRSKSRVESLQGQQDMIESQLRRHKRARFLLKTSRKQIKSGFEYSIPQGKSTTQSVTSKLVAGDWVEKSIDSLNIQIGHTRSRIRSLQDDLSTTRMNLELIKTVKKRCIDWIIAKKDHIGELKVSLLLSKTIPDIILRQIFIEVMHDSTSQMQPASGVYENCYYRHPMATIAQVCRLWNHVALQNPSLWRQVRLHDNADLDGSLDCLRYHRIASGKLSLDIEIIFNRVMPVEYSMFWYGYIYKGLEACNIRHLAIINQSPAIRDFGVPKVGSLYLQCSESFNTIRLSAPLQVLVLNQFMGQVLGLGSKMISATIINTPGTYYGRFFNHWLTMKNLTLISDTETSSSLVYRLTQPFNFHRLEIDWMSARQVVPASEPSTVGSLVAHGLSAAPRPGEETVLRNETRLFSSIFARTLELPNVKDAEDLENDGLHTTILYYALKAPQGVKTLILSNTAIQPTLRLLKLNAEQSVEKADLILDEFDRVELYNMGQDGSYFSRDELEDITRMTKTLVEERTRVGAGGIVIDNNLT